MSMVKMQSLPPLVIDKSFAQKTRAEQLQTLSMRFAFWVPSAFIFEVFDGEPEKRRHALKGFGEFGRVDIAAMLRRETAAGEPISDINLPSLSFNPDVLSVEWNPRPDILESLQAYKKQVEHLISFWGSVIDHGVIGFSASELTAIRGTNKDFETLCGKLRDLERIKGIAAEMGFKHASILNETWLQYRKFQTWILQGLILLRRHMNPGDKRSQTRIEHDVQDIEYLILALHAGSLATAETSEKLTNASMGWRFRLLEPNGRLVTPASLQSFL
jgi:hypothetical protein